MPSKRKTVKLRFSIRKDFKSYIFSPYTKKFSPYFKLQKNTLNHGFKNTAILFILEILIILGLEKQLFCCFLLTAMKNTRKTLVVRLWKPGKFRNTVFIMKFIILRKMVTELLLQLKGFWICKKKFWWWFLKRNLKKFESIQEKITSESIGKTS